MLGAVPTIPVQLTGDFGTLMGWVDGFRTMKVRANSDTPTTPKLPATSGLKGSACAAPNTCSSMPSALRRCAK